MCLGESTTAQGSGNSYPRQLERILNQRNTGIKFKVINKGVGGTTSAHIVAKLENNINKYDPNMIIVMMGINDIYGGVIAYEEAPPIKTALFLKSFRIFKLTKLLRLRITQRLEEKMLVVAEKSLKKAIEKNLNGVTAYSNLADHYWEQGKLVEAEELLEEALEIGLKNDATYLTLAEYYREQGKLVEAEELLEEALELNPKNDIAYLRLANYYWEQGKLVKAEELLEEALELNPKNDIVYLRLAKYYWEQKKFVEAEKLLKRAIKISPKNDTAYLDLAENYWQQGKSVEADEISRKAIKIFSKNDDIYYKISPYLHKKEYSRKAHRRKAAYVYSQEIREIDAGWYKRATIHNYQKLRKTAAKKGVKLIFMQYPMRNVEPLKNLFRDKESLVFVDNEGIFKAAVARENYNKYFIDKFGGDFGHCTVIGNRLLAKNVAHTLFKEFFKK